MSARWERFNINQAVRVKLKPAGLAIMKLQHDDMTAYIKAIRPDIVREEWRPPAVDADGWSRFQLWVLMQTFGAHFSLGIVTDKQPFELEIEIGFGT